MSDDHDTMIRTLEATGQFRILRRLGERVPVEPPSGIVPKLAIYLDTETTGLDPAKDEIIELAMIPFTYGDDGTIYEIGTPFQAFREPSQPIPPEITLLTGITDEMVAGHTISVEEVAAFIEPAVLIIAHNAGFDRLFAERFCEAFTFKSWACSVSQIPWKEEGFPGTRLAYLASHMGFFFDGHRAVEDCRAAIELLALPLPRSGRTGLAALLECARLPTWRIWAENSPFDLKDVLKVRGYRWNDGSNGKPRAWWADIPDERRESELTFLVQEIYQREIDLRPVLITAFDRFSDRV
jgi:DNA polymerase-3 subunit epsilon